jgi:hypothetical protein
LFSCSTLFSLKNNERTSLRFWCKLNIFYLQMANLKKLQ